MASVLSSDESPDKLPVELPDTLSQIKKLTETRDLSCPTDEERDVQPSAESKSQPGNKIERENEIKGATEKKGTSK